MNARNEESPNFSNESLGLEATRQKWSLPLARSVGHHTHTNDLSSDAAATLLRPLAWAVIVGPRNQFSVFGPERCRATGERQRGWPTKYALELCCARWVRMSPWHCVSDVVDESSVSGPEIGNARL